jgi:hypothetical protein
MNSDSIELLQLFAREKIKYLIVDGYAVSFHTEPRYTKDIDIFIATDRQNAQAVYKALAEFGVALTDATPEDFENTEQFYMIGAPPNRIDIMMGIPGVDFDRAWDHRVEADFEGVTITYISLDDLIVAKRAAGRDQDHLDLKILEEAKKLRKD